MPEPAYHHLMPRAVAYIRASTADQTQTVDARRDRIAAWAEREGVDVVAYHVDAGVSGTTPAHKRPGLSDALVDVENSKAELLVVTTRDIDGRLAPYEPEQAALRRLYELDAAGISQREIVDVLNEERHPARGERWHRSGVRRLLARRAEAAA